MTDDIAQTVSEY